jgi:hypothetical protein
MGGDSPGYAYNVPDDVAGVNTKRSSSLVRIILAIIFKTQVIIFIDHNGLMTFTCGVMPMNIERSDLEPGGQVGWRCSHDEDDN